MKKVISLMLMLALVLTFIPMMASADGEAYSFVYDSDGAYFTITSGATAMGGRLAIRLETAKVKPVAVIVTGSGKNQKTSYEVATAETSAEIWGELNYSASATYYATDDKYTYIGVDWYDTASVEAGSDVGYLNVEIADESLLDSESIVCDFDVAAVDGFLSETAGFYGSVIGAGVTTTQPVSFTYPNSDKEVGPIVPPVEDKWEAGEDVVTDEFKAALDADVDYVKAIAVFGKNAAGTEYTVTFGANSYAGTAVVGQPWAMVLYDDGSKGYDLIGADSYAYTVTAGEATWSGTATAITK